MLYIISAILGLSAVVLTTSGEVRAMMFLMALCSAGAVGWRLYLNRKTHQDPQAPAPHDNDPFFGEEDRSEK